MAEFSPPTPGDDNLAIQRPGGEGAVRREVITPA